MVVHYCTTISRGKTTGERAQHSCTTHTRRGCNVAQPVLHLSVTMPETLHSSSKKIRVFAQSPTRQASEGRRPSSGWDAGGVAARRPVAESSECQRRLAGSNESSTPSSPQQLPLSSVGYPLKKFFPHSASRPRPPRGQMEVAAISKSPAATVMRHRAASIKFAAGPQSWRGGRVRPMALGFR